MLPEAFAQDPERLARFQREAELLATLNSNIAGFAWRPALLDLVGADARERIPSTDRAPSAARIETRSCCLALRPRCHHDARELRICRTVAEPVRYGCQGAKEYALHHQWWRTEHDDVTELRRSKREL